MRRNDVKYLMAIIAFLGSVILVLVYYFWPTTSTSNRLHELVIHCIPEAIVALMAVPVIYWLFERRGILPDSQLKDHGKGLNSGSIMASIPEEIEKASREAEEIRSAASNPGGEGKEILVVVDIQEDFVSGSLKAYDASRIINPLNSAIRLAESKGMIIVFTKDWHPKNHWSFKENNGPWETHCVRGTSGAQLVEDLYVPPGSVIVEFGVEADRLGYSPLENSAFAALLESPAVKTVYIAGIALEYCVQSTCIGAVDKGKKVIALESVIATAHGNLDDAERVWAKLLKIGVERQKRYAALGES